MSRPNKSGIDWSDPESRRLYQKKRRATSLSLYERTLDSNCECQKRIRKRNRAKAILTRGQNGLTTGKGFTYRIVRSDVFKLKQKGKTCAEIVVLLGRPYSVISSIYDSINPLGT